MRKTLDDTQALEVRQGVINWLSADSVCTPLPGAVEVYRGRKNRRSALHFGLKCVNMHNGSVIMTHTHTENSMPNDADTQNKIANEDLKVHAFIVKSAFMYLFVWNTFSKIFSELQMTVDAAAQVKIHLHVLKQRQQCEKWLWVYSVQKQQGEQQ